MDQNVSGRIEDTAGKRKNMGAVKMRKYKIILWTMVIMMLLLTGIMLLGASTQEQLILVMTYLLIFLILFAKNLRKGPGGGNA